MNNKKKLLVLTVIMVSCFCMNCGNGVAGSDYSGTMPPVNWNLSLDMYLDGLNFQESEELEGLDDFVDFTFTLAYGMGTFVVGGAALCEDEGCQHFKEEDDDFERDVHPAIWYSTDGAKTWTKKARVFDNSEKNGLPRNHVNNNDRISAVGFGGGTFIAGTGSGSGPGYLITSTNAIDWNEVESIKSNPIERRFTRGRIIYGNRTFVYEPARRPIMRPLVSKDYGQTWIECNDKIDTRENFLPRPTSASISFDNGLFYAIGNWNDENQDDSPYYLGIASSPDGIDWNIVVEEVDGESAAPTALEGIRPMTFCAVGDVFIASYRNHYDGWSESGFAYSNDRGVTWESAYCDPAVASLDSWVIAITYGNGYLVAVGSADDEGKIWYSNDLGKSWRTVNTQFDDDSLVSITYGDGTFVAASETGKFYYCKVK